MVKMDESISRRTAIVVDDDEDTVNLFTEFLDICGIKVIGKAFNGKQAAEVYAKTKPDIVFSDVMMPEYDGFYAIEQIRKQNPDVIMVMITGDVRSETVHTLESLGADAIIYKPFDMQTIIATVEKLLATKLYNKCKT